MTGIATESEYDCTASVMNRLVVIPEREATPEQTRLLDLLTLLVERYDEEHYQIPSAAPHEVLQYLMEERSLRNKDLEATLGESRRYVRSHQRQTQAQQGANQKSRRVFRRRAGSFHLVGLRETLCKSTQAKGAKCMTPSLMLTILALAMRASEYAVEQLKRQQV